nr:hypothetical protein [Marinicella sp. W31]MDC2875957.1 hypothetical protein [Marinicella sp. W31]
MMAGVIGNAEALGEDYNLTGGHAVTWREVLSLYLDETEAVRGRRPEISLLSLEAFCKTCKNVPQVIYDRVYNRRFDPRKIAANFDMSTLQDPLPALAGRLRSQLDPDARFGTVEWRGEALRDRATGAHARLGEIHGLKTKLYYLGYRHISPGAIKRMRQL